MKKIKLQMFDGSFVTACKHREEEIISFLIEEYKNIAHTFSILFTPVNTPT